VNITDGTNSSTATFYDNRTEFSDPVLIPDGTAANPAFAFASDTDFGLYLSSGYASLQSKNAVASQGLLTVGPKYAEIRAYEENGTDRANVLVSDVGSMRIDMFAATASAATTFTGQFSPTLTHMYHDSATDDSQYQATANSFSWNADVDDDGDGTITMATGNDTMQTVLSANSFAVSADDGTSDTADLDLTTTGNNPIFKAAIVAAGGADVALTFQGPSTGQALFDIDGSTHDIRGSFIDFDFDDTDSIVEFYFDDNEFRLGQNVTQEFEGATNDGNETVLTVEDPTADRTVTLPDETGYVDANQRGTSTLTDNTATSLLLFALADTEFAYGSITLQTYCEDATDMVGTHEEYDFVCHNDADTEDCAFGVKTGTKPVSGTGAANITTHTLTATYQTNQVTLPSSFRPIAR
jgi:hypothetical protein